MGGGWVGGPESPKTDVHVHTFGGWVGAILKLKKRMFMYIRLGSGCAAGAIFFFPLTKNELQKAEKKNRACGAPMPPHLCT